MKPLYLGIDFGTSGDRALVIDRQGNIHAEVEHSFGSLGDDAAAVWQEALFELLGEIPAQVQGDIEAIAIDGTSSTVLLCDQAGSPVYPPLLYSDARATAGAETLKELAPSGHVVLSATSSLAKLLWFAQQSCFAQVRYLMHQADWLAYLLHRQPGISDYHNSLKLGYDPALGRYPEWLTGATQLQEIVPLLPQVLTPGSSIGSVQPEIAARFGFAPDCRVCAGTTDSIAAFLASGAASPGEAVTSLGSTLALKLLSTVRVDNSDYGVYSHRLGDQWLVGGASNVGGAVLRRFFSDTELGELSCQIQADQESPLDYYPLLEAGDRFPVNDPYLPPRLTPRPDNPVEFLHGLLESLARIEAQGYALLQQQGATPLTQVYTAGGGAKNPAWTQIRGRHLQVPLARSRQSAAAYGAALVAQGVSSHPVSEKEPIHGSTR